MESVTTSQNPWHRSGTYILLTLHWQKPVVRPHLGAREPGKYGSLDSQRQYDPREESSGFAVPVTDSCWISTSSVTRLDGTQPGFLLVSSVSEAAFHSTQPPRVPLLSRYLPKCELLQETFSETLIATPRPSML